MTCPRCQEAEASSERCPRCGVVVATYLAALEKMRRTPAPRPSAPAAPLVAAAASGGVYALSFHGHAGTLFGIQIVNMLRALLSLGGYYFWGKARVRSYVFGQTAVEGDRFAYHGTGGELARGFARAMAFFILPVIALNLLPRLFGAGPLLERSAQLLGYVVVSVFMPIAAVGAHRYRLSRTSWRGIRFSFRGRTPDFGQLFLGGSVLPTLPPGPPLPLFFTPRGAFFGARAHFGNLPLGVVGDGRQI